jgi:hypothetical protein
MLDVVTKPPNAGVRMFRPSERQLALAPFRAFIDDIAAPMRVFIDGREVGDLWANQIKYFDVKPGTHTVQLRQYIVRFNKLVISAEDGQTVELACWSSRWAFLSKALSWTPYPYLHQMTPRERRRVERMAAKSAPPTPRNLAEG